MTEHDRNEECRLASTSIEQATQEEFDALFGFFYPDRLNNVQFSKIATDKGGCGRAFSYALFNVNVISREWMQHFLVEMNEKYQRPL